MVQGVRKKVKGETIIERKGQKNVTLYLLHGVLRQFFLSIFCKRVKA